MRKLKLVSDILWMIVVTEEYDKSSGDKTKAPAVSVLVNVFFPVHTSLHDRRQSALCIIAFMVHN